ncbi:MAG: dephospho-CoA kinase [Muribaculaceae bacterium]|nr:dephospho-CoA kinase [Muribaculaceae bacterium]
MLIAITGGIGAGKSVVSQILRTLGYPVYDCDMQARIIMDNDREIHHSLCRHIHPQAVVDGIIDRPLIASVVFNDPDALARLNNIVHGAVTDHLGTWSRACTQDGREIQFVETAIPVQSGLYRRVDAIWHVTAPVPLRIERVQRRSGLSPAQVLARIEAQQSENLDNIPHQDIRNDSDTPLLPRLHHLLHTIHTHKN